MIKEFTKMSMNSDTVDWLTQWVKDLRDSDQTKSADKLDSFVKTMDVIMDRMNNLNLFVVLLNNANTTGHQVIVQMHNDFIKDNSSIELTSELLQTLENYADAQKIVNNAEHAFTDNVDDDYEN